TQPGMARPGGLRPGLCGNSETVACSLRAGRREWCFDGFCWAVPRPVALLPHVLRGRLSRRCDRRGTGDLVQGRVSSTGLKSLAELTRARHRGNVAPSNSYRKAPARCLVLATTRLKNVHVLP